MNARRGIEAARLGRMGGCVPIARRRVPSPAGGWKLRTNPSLTAMGALILALPIAVEVPHDSSGAPGHETRISIGGGVGTYAMIMRDCEGNAIGSTPVTYREAGAAVDQRVAGPLHVGIRGGVLRDEVGTNRGPFGGESSIISNRYANPYLSVEGRRGGFGIGGIFSDQSFFASRGNYEARFSGHLRVGGRRRYFSAGLMENMPLYSGGGFFDLGVGFRAHPRVDGWIGLSAPGPFDGAGLAFKAAWQVHPRWTLDLNTRFGTSGGEFEGGVGVGITSRLGGPSGGARLAEPLSGPRTPLPEPGRGDQSGRIVPKEGDR